MRRIAVKKIKGMNQWAKYALVTLSALLVSAFMYESAFALSVPVMHNSSSTGNKYGSWGLDKDCTWCHSNDTNNVKLVSETIITPNGIRTVFFTRMTASLNSTTGVLGNDARGYAGNGTGGSANICEVCHRQTPFHKYSAVAPIHFDNKLCTTCHIHADGFVAAKMACNSCHGDKNVTAEITAANRYVVAPPTSSTGNSGVLSGTGEVSNDPKVGAHQTHLLLSNGFSNYSTVDFRCQNCHGTLPVSGSPPQFAHVNGSSALDFQGLANNRGARTTTFSSTNLTCSNTYCHNPAGTGGTLAAANAGSAIFPSWTGAKYIADGTAKTDSNCNRCHKVPGSAGFSFQGSHSQSTVVGYDCTSCHGHNGNVAGAVGQRHIDGIRYAAGGHDYPYSGSLHKGDAVPISNCTTCHTNTSGTYPVTRPAKPDCRSCHVKASPGTGCNTCHGRSTTGGGALNYSAARPNGGIAGGFPNYSGSHTVHVIKKGYSCDGCHNGYGTGHPSHGFSNTSGATYSRTNFKKMAFTIGGTPTYTKATTTCSNLTGCHVTAVWGGRLGCINCHSAAITRTLGRPGVVIQSVTAEFGLAWGHKKSGRATVSDDDCIVCHLEGNATTHVKSALHGDGNIDLRDPDVTGETPITNMSNATWTFQRYSTSFAAGTRTATGNTANTIDNIITQKFCLKCHDSAGAANTFARSNNGGTGTNAMPFGGYALGANYTAGNGAIGTQGTINVATQFAVTNSSVHPVLGPRDKDFPTAGRMANPYKPTGSRGTAGVTSQGVVITCNDCHKANYTTTRRMISAHGNAVTVAGRVTTTGSAFTVGTNDVTFCKECHLAYETSGAAAGTAPTSHHGTGSAVAAGTNNGMTDYMAYACNICHASGYNTAVVRPIRALDVHGNNVLPSGGLTKEAGSRWAGASVGTPAQVNARPYAFIRNTEILTTHSPGKVGGTVYSPNCTMGNGTPGCSRANKIYTGGGTYY